MEIWTWAYFDINKWKVLLLQFKWQKRFLFLLLLLLLLFSWETIFILVWLIYISKTFHSIRMSKFKKSWISSSNTFFMRSKTIQNNWPAYLWEKLDKRKWLLHAERKYFNVLTIFLRWKKETLHDWKIFMFLFFIWKFQMSNEIRRITFFYFLSKTIRS